MINKSLIALDNKLQNTISAYKKAMNRAYSLADKEKQLMADFESIAGYKYQSNEHRIAVLNAELAAEKIICFESKTGDDIKHSLNRIIRIEQALEHCKNNGGL